MSNISKEELKKLDAYFRASNYLSVGQLYLLDNPLLKRPLQRSDIKKKIRNYFIVVKLLFHIVCYTENVHESITTGYEKPDAAC